MKILPPFEERKQAMDTEAGAIKKPKKGKQFELCLRNGVCAYCGTTWCTDIKEKKMLYQKQWQVRPYKQNENNQDKEEIKPEETKAK